MSWTRFVRAAASAESDRVKAQIRAAVRSLVLLIAAALLLLVGLIFTLAGLYGSLAEVQQDVQAGGLIGLGAQVICVLLVAASSGCTGAASAAPADGRGSGSLCRARCGREHRRAGLRRPTPSEHLATGARRVRVRFDREPPAAATG